MWFYHCYIYLFIVMMWNASLRCARGKEESDNTVIQPCTMKGDQRLVVYIWNINSAFIFTPVSFGNNWILGKKSISKCPINNIKSYKNEISLLVISYSFWNRQVQRKTSSRGMRYKIVKLVWQNYTIDLALRKSFLYDTFLGIWSLFCIN